MYTATDFIDTRYISEPGYHPFFVESGPNPKKVGQPWIKLLGYSHDFDDAMVN